MKVSTSFLSCKKIVPTIKKLSLTDTDFIHIDYIDGSFVKGKKIPFRKLKKVDTYSSKRLDVHLMTSKLKKNIKKFASYNCEYITFHLESTTDVEKYIYMVHAYGIKCGLAVNPETDFEKLKPYMEMIDLVLVMGVNPGYGGQSFIPDIVNKLKEIRNYIIDNKIKVIVSVDGGINAETFEKVESYTDMVVSGSYVTNSDDYQKQINTLR